MSKIRFIFILILSMALFLASCRNSADLDSEEAVTPTGAIYYIEKPIDSNHRIMRVDPAKGVDQAEVVFTAGDLAELQEIELFDDGTKLVFSQVPTPSVNTGIFDRTTLSMIDLTGDTTQAEPLLGGEVPNEFYNMPVSSPDGRYLFYTRLGPDREGITGTDTFYGIERYDFETGEKIPIVPNSIWPQVSPDGSKLSFIILDLPTQQRGLGIVNIDGTDPKLLIDIGRYFDIDSPIFSQDGQSLYLSIVPEQPTASFIERLLGIKVAYAHTEHNIPSTWWRLPLSSESEDEAVEPEPLDTTEIILINGRFHPSNPFMALSTTEGLKFLQLDQATEGGSLNYTDYSQQTDLGMLDWIDPAE